MRKKERKRWRNDTSKPISTQSKNKQIVSIVAVLFGLIYSFNAIVISSIRSVRFFFLAIFIIATCICICCLYLLIFCWFSSSLGIHTTELTHRSTSDRQNGKFNVHENFIFFSLFEQIEISLFHFFLMFRLLSLKNQSNEIKISFNLSANLYYEFAFFLLLPKNTMSSSLLEFNFDCVYINTMCEFLYLIEKKKSIW